MKQFELPVVYIKNYKEVNQALEQGLPDPEREEDIIMTTFFITDNTLFRINAFGKRTTLYFMQYDNTYHIDADYESVLEIIKRSMK